jgi:hypothetical protein
VIDVLSEMIGLAKKYESYNVIYSDPSFIVGIRQSDHSVLEKTTLHKVLVGLPPRVT